MESIVKCVFLFLFLHSARAADEFQCAEFHENGTEIKKFSFSPKKFPFQDSLTEYLDAYDNNDTKRMDNMLKLLQNTVQFNADEEDPSAVDVIPYVVSGEIKLIENF